jgi:hypothetical protein
LRSLELPSILAITPFVLEYGKKNPPGLPAGLLWPEELVAFATQLKTIAGLEVDAK